MESVYRAAQMQKSLYLPEQSKKFKLQDMCLGLRPFVRKVSGKCSIWQALAPIHVVVGKANETE